MTVIRGLVAMLAVCGLVACATGPDKGSQGAPTTDELINRIRAESASLKTFAGRGSIKINDRERQHYFEVMVAAAQPDRLRLQAFDFIGRPILTIITGGDQLRYLDYRQAKLVYGQATPENLRRMLPVAMQVPELVGILSGIPIVPVHERAEVNLDRTTGPETWIWSLFLPGGKWVDRFRLTRADNLIRQVDRGPVDGQSVLRLEYGNFKPVSETDGRQTPYHVSAADLKTQTELIIDYTEVKINPSLPEGLFTLPAPPGVKVEPIPGAEGGT
ncbi:MAG: DUF4292 domain-containing protein [Deltaproteobacteria bacterium]|nr:DUF4292 domain-containing protein [Deltaproteobacteria bacterium]